jgi:hypothetical protein
MSGPGEATLQQWSSFWMIPLLFSVVVLILFTFGFNEKLKPTEKVISP